MKSPNVTARQASLLLLGRRDYSRAELMRKLVQRQYPLAEIDAALTELASQNYQSDARFCASYLRMRMNSGFGPLRIIPELRYRGVSDDVIQAQLREADIEWPTLALQVWQKKFKGKQPRTIVEKAKQLTFLQHRGFDLSELPQLEVTYDENE